jgi:protein-tyrosine phosphatase
MAEAVFARLVTEAGLEDVIAVDSAGTGSWHIGEPAHSGTRQILARHGIQYRGRARQVTARDMKDPATYVVAMDASNLGELERRFGGHPRVSLLLDHAVEVDVSDVPDPYFHDNFDRVYELVEAGTRGLLAHIREAEGL